MRDRRICVLVGASAMLLSNVSRADSNNQSTDVAGLKPIVVTAQRVAENLQNVPVAVTAISASQIANEQIVSVSDIGNTIPNVSMQTQFGEPATPFLTIRGFSNGSLTGSVDSPVAIYVDDVYVGRAVGAAFDLPDLQDIEVLRGPQGTLFGRNATGGAIDFHTAPPSGQLDGHVEATFGDYNLERVSGTLDLPSADGLSSRITVLHTQNDGYVQNSDAHRSLTLPAPFGTITSGSSFGSNDETAIAGALRYDGMRRLTVDYRVDYSHQVQMQLGTQGLGFETAEGFQQLLVSSQGGAVPVSLQRLGSLPLAFQTPGTLNTFGNSLTAQYQLSDDLTLKSISAYRSFTERTGGNEIDGGLYTGNALTASVLGIPAGTPWTLISSFAQRSQHQVSEEAQLLGNQGPVDWIAGAYFYNEHNAENDPVISGFFGTGTLTTAALAGILPGSYLLGANDRNDNTSVAGYGHATIHLSHKIDVSGGARYTKDTKEYQNLFLGTTQTFRGSHVDWDGSATYKITPDANVYAKASTGYLAGGALGTRTFKPETNRSYEIGLRSMWFERRLRFNVTGFNEHVNDLQVTEFDAVHGTYIINSGNETISGVEVELMAKPSQAITLNASYGHQSTPTGVNPVTGAGTPSLYPADNLTLAGEYATNPFAHGAYLGFHLQGTWTSGNPEIASLPTNAADTALFNATSVPSEWEVDARITLASIPIGANTTGQISLWGRNLLDNHGIAFARDVFFVVGQFEPPMTFGADFSIDF